jgi:iron complex outermembrane recepter protein
MSELVNARANQKNFRWQLLANVSAIALLGSSYGVGAAQAADDNSDRPSIWIELGGQLSRLDDAQEAFAPHLMANRPSVLSPSQKFEQPPLYSIDEYGKVSFEPNGSDWVLSASVRYGRSGSDRDVREQTNPMTRSLVLPSTTIHFKPISKKFADTNAQNDERHSIVDFQVGKDVGLGMFGNKGASSVVNLGVRFAQFSAKSNIALKSDPDWHFAYLYFAGFKIPYYQPYHSNAASFVATRSFHGIGPSISWSASEPVAGNEQTGEIGLDWGVNAAFLFGRQRTKAHHQATGQYHSRSKYSTLHHTRHVTYQPTPVDATRSHTVAVPNVGGFAGLSFRYSNAKISAGYRADLFFNAMDGGIDARKNENVGFYGPFASVSVGIGG